MSIQKCDKIEKYIISKDGYDTIFVLAEQFSDRQCQVTIRCYDRCWTAYWGGAGSKGWKAFFLSCNNGYLATNFIRGTETPEWVVDLEEIENQYKKRIIDARREGEIDKDDAREKWDMSEEIQSWSLDEVWYKSEFLEFTFGEYWHESMPQTTSSDYKYICRLVQVVREHLEEGCE